MMEAIGQRKEGALMSYTDIYGLSRSKIEQGRVDIPVLVGLCLIAATSLLFYGSLFAIIFCI
ncbi:hypothetical protein ASF77_02950 [Massilia sp. Leaf139]|nr:hypothetical protein ASF77_02950 [Massilia sp. Leaf139]